MRGKLIVQRKIRENLYRKSQWRRHKSQIIRISLVRHESTSLSLFITKNNNQSLLLFPLIDNVVAFKNQILSIWNSFRSFDVVAGSLSENENQENKIKLFITTSSKSEVWFFSSLISVSVVCDVASSTDELATRVNRKRVD